MKAMYGNMKRVSPVASVKASGFSLMPPAMAQTRSGAAMTPRTLTMKTASASTVKTLSMKRFSPSSGSFSLTSESIGTNACWKAPSAKRRRSILGSLKAT